MSVEESTVILGPIDQVGWFSASATPTAASSSRVRPRTVRRRGEQQTGDV